MVLRPPPASPDALLFDALVNSRTSLARQEADELADLVLRLAGAVRETTVALREASACLAGGQDPDRLPELLIRAEGACREQADCTTALIQHLAPRLAAA
ncbi:hypothetical protein KTR66_18615 [Roseococcus sp. SDR]|uniref:hypothetical protein n=1 Tax=Roseococcus sp. SDR TaxID=2835532 RepID=UPI001BD02C0E|nr:hypothetical protein [Roseococcus sp. SDR]MBS7792020.1 hypothetical protein [Roseococcus sp. SDR]MBV1847334.1 hypothetical protein [Roseococcus sp. SDR]